MALGHLRQSMTSPDAHCRRVSPLWCPNLSYYIAACIQSWPILYIIQDTAQSETSTPASSLEEIHSAAAVQFSRFHGSNLTAFCAKRMAASSPFFCLAIDSRRRVAAVSSTDRFCFNSSRPLVKPIAVAASSKARPKFPNRSLLLTSVALRCTAADNARFAPTMSF